MSEPRRVQLSRKKGKNLACWCGLDRDCHANVLLEIANLPEFACYEASTSGGTDD